MIESILDLPQNFEVIYECADCGEQYELMNCLVPRLQLPCEECGVPSMFYAQYLIHKSWEWDMIELIIDEDEDKGSERETV